MRQFWNPVVPGSFCSRCFVRVWLARTHFFHCSRHLKIANFGSVGFIRFQPHLSSSFFPMVFHGFPLTSWKHKINFHRFPHGFPIGSRAGAPLCAPCQSGVVPSAAGGDGSWRVSLMFCYEWGYDMTWYMIYDIWYMIYDIWYMIYDIWYDMIWYMIWYDMYNDIHMCVYVDLHI